jgi:hypothetical protein
MGVITPKTVTARAAGRYRDFTPEVATPPVLIGPE